MFAATDQMISTAPLTAQCIPTTVLLPSIRMSTGNHTARSRRLGVMALATVPSAQ
jgi:hypothetical protein